MGVDCVWLFVNKYGATAEDFRREVEAGAYPGGGPRFFWEPHYSWYRVEPAKCGYHYIEFLERRDTDGLPDTAALVVIHSGVRFMYVQPAGPLAELAQAPAVDFVTKLIAVVSRLTGDERPELFSDSAW